MLRADFAPSWNRTFRDKALSHLQPLPIGRGSGRFALAMGAVQRPPDLKSISSQVARIPGAGAIQRRLMRRFCTAYAAQRPLDSEAFTFGEVLRSLHALLAHGRHRAGCGPVPIPYESPAAIRRLEARLVRHGAGGRLDPGHPSV